MLTPESIIPLLNTGLTIEQCQDVKDLLRSTPELCQEYGSLFDWTRDAILKILHPNTVKYLCTAEGLNQMREQLLEPGDSQVERVAVEQILTAHLQVAKTGYRLESLEPTDENLNRASYWSKTHDRAHARLMKAMHSLLRVRKARLDMNMKLWKNRPNSWPGLDYLVAAVEETKENAALRKAEAATDAEGAREADESSGEHVEISPAIILSPEEIERRALLQSIDILAEQYYERKDREEELKYQRKKSKDIVAPRSPEAPPSREGIDPEPMAVIRTENEVESESEQRNEVPHGEETNQEIGRKSASAILPARNVTLTNLRMAQKRAESLMTSADRVDTVEEVPMSPELFEAKVQAARLRLASTTSDGAHSENFDREPLADCRRETGKVVDREPLPVDREGGEFQPESEQNCSSCEETFIKEETSDHATIVRLPNNEAASSDEVPCEADATRASAREGKAGEPNQLKKIENDRRIGGT